MTKNNAKRGFTYSMLALILMVLAVIIQFLNSVTKAEIFPIAVGVFGLMSFILATIGLISSILGLRESTSMEQIVGVTVNGIFVMFFIFIIVEVVQKLNQA